MAAAAAELQSAGGLMQCTLASKCTASSACVASVRARKRCSAAGVQVEVIAPVCQVTGCGTEASLPAGTPLRCWPSQGKLQPCSHSPILPLPMLRLLLTQSTCSSGGEQQWCGTCCLAQATHHMCNCRSWRSICTWWYRSGCEIACDALHHIRLLTAWLSCTPSSAPLQAVALIASSWGLPS